MANEESIEKIGPYIGLRPYEESNRDIFFGREEEQEIIIDKLIANKLTLLFAASGVGKSSLLRAAVLPGLKQMKKENPDVVYYCDWVSDPLEHLKKETVRVLRDQKRVAEDYAVYREDEETSLKKFFRLCAIFAGEPLVVILDQFEEFFQYRRYKENFIKFIEEFSECIKDRETPVVFLISMREDFALELNAFKKYLPTILFENYFRLEKLTEEKAREAIVKPVERFGFHYEEKLLETLLNDLAQREKESQLGISPDVLVKDMPAYVEPPYLQIVCSRLWKTDQNDPERKIREDSYDKIGRARGVVDSYFHEVMNRFSLSEKKIASSAFDLLITPRGTRMAYTAKDLSDRTGSEEKELENVLEKLRKSMILRSQKREGVIWYELYHDIFASIINRWNEKFKSKQRIKRVSLVTAMAILAFLVLFIIYDIISNSTGHYLRLSVKETISDRIEVYRGNLKIPDIFGLHEYQTETSFERDQVEPDKLFGEKQIGDFDLLNRELIGHLPLIERISAYWEAGEINKAFDLIKNSISENDITRSKQILGLLPGYGTLKSYELLKERLGKSDRSDIREAIINALAKMPPALIVDDFVSLLKDQDAAIQRKVNSTLGQRGNEQAVGPLIKLLKDSDWQVQKHAVEVLGMIGSERAVEPLIGLITDQYSSVNNDAAKALGKIGSEKAVGPLLALLKHPSEFDRASAAEALGKIGSEKAVEPLIGLLKLPDWNLRNNAVDALGKLGSEKAVEPLLGLLKYPHYLVRVGAAKALGNIGSDRAVAPLLGLLKDPEEYVRRRAVEAFGQIGNEKTVAPLLGLLKGPESIVQRNAAEVLGNICNEKAVPSLIGLLKDPNEYVRRSAAWILGKIGNDKAIEPLLGLLKDLDLSVKDNAIWALVQIGSEKAVEPLIGLLKDPNFKARDKVAEALGQLGSEKTVESLLGLLKNPVSDVRIRTSFVLGQLGSENAVTPLQELLKDPDKDVRCNAAAHLGQIGNEKAVEPLLSLLKYRYWPAQVNVAVVLGQMGCEKAADDLIDLLKDPNLYIRKNAAAALGNIGSEKSVKPLLRLLNDPDKDVRTSAALALGQIGCEKAIKPLLHLLKEPDSYAQDSAAAALGNIGSDNAVAPLLALLKDPSFYARDKVAEALGQIGSEKAVAPLLGLLKDSVENVYNPLNEDPFKDVRKSGAEALGKIGSSKAIEPLASLLNDIDPDVRKSTVLSLGKLSAQEKINIIKNLYTNQKEKIYVRITAAATLLKLGDETGLDYLKEISKQDNFNKRVELAAVLGEVPSKQGNSILIEMLADENIRVKENAIYYIGKTRDKPSLPHLNQLIQYPNGRIRAAAAYALSEIAAPESIDLLKKVALNTGERMFTRGIVITALAKIQHQDALQILIELLDNESSAIQYKTVISIGKNPPTASLPNDLINQLKARLNDKLKVLEERKAQWRKIRDENTNSYNEEKLKDWNNRLEEVDPREALEFELAFVLSRIDPGNEGVKLLGSDLANVREGAWTGLGKSRDVSLIEKLYWQRKQSDIPWFIHAAYRAIDHILTGIEAFGGEEELNRLEALYKSLSGKEGKNFHEGVQTRMEWTIDRLKERLPQNN